MIWHMISIEPASKSFGICDPYYRVTRLYVKSLTTDQVELLETALSVTFSCSHKELTNSCLIIGRITVVPVLYCKG